MHRPQSTTDLVLQTGMRLGTWYACLGGRNVPLTPEVNDGQVSWYVTEAAGLGLSAVREDELRWTSGDMPE